MAKAQRAESSSLISSDARLLVRVIRRIRAEYIDAAPIRVAFASTLVALVALAWLERSVSTGFRIYVLTRALRTAWAATIAVGAAALAAIAVNISARGRTTVAVRAISAALAFTTAISALGAILPDWSEFSCVIAGAVVVLWAAGLLIASRGSANSSNE